MADVDRTIQVGAAIGLATIGVESFHKFMPSVADIRKASPGDKGIAADVHAGEVLAGVTTFTVGFLASTVTRNGLPLFISSVGFLAMIGTYEWLLRANKPFEGS